MQRTTLTRGLPAAIVAAAVLFGVGIGPAAAHVEPDPEEAPKGGSAEIAFRVPTERDNADTTKVVLALPADHPIASVTPRPNPGWTVAVTRTKDAVSRITWSGGKIPPDQSHDFTVSLDPLPTDTDELVFKVLQTYSDGEVVRWIEAPLPGGGEPEHPAPTVKLVGEAPATTTNTTTATTTTAPTTTATTVARAADDSGTPALSTKDVASTDDVDSAKTIAIVGVVLGVLALAGAIVAIVLVRRRPSP